MVHKTITALLGGAMFFAPVAVATIAAPVASACDNYDYCEGNGGDALVWVDGPDGRDPVLKPRWQVEDGWCWVKRHGYDGYTYYWELPPR